MSVRSRIAIKQKDNTYKSIGCNSDGQLSGNGELLYRYYRDPVKINMLMNLGDLSYLEKNIFPNPLKVHNFDNPQDDVCVAYCRDRGNEMYVEEDKDLEHLLMSVANSDQDYLYLYEDGTWKFANTQTKNYKEIELKDLESTLIEYNVIDQPLFSIDYYIDELTSEIVDYTKNSDPYEYKDLYSTDEDAFNSIRKSLITTSDVESTIEWIGADIDYYASENDLSNPEIYRNFKIACNLLYELNQYGKGLEYTFDKEMDM